MLHELSINIGVVLCATFILAGTVILAYRCAQTVNRFIKEGINHEANRPAHSARRAPLGPARTEHPTLPKDVVEQLQQALDMAKGAVV